jgi:hypothetical protein
LWRLSRPRPAALATVAMPRALATSERADNKTAGSGSSEAAVRYSACSKTSPQVLGGAARRPSRRISSKRRLSCALRQNRAI